MLSFLEDFFSIDRIALLIYSAAALAVLATAWLRRHDIQFFLLRLWYGLPLLGKLARLSRDLNRNSPAAGWYNSEWELCNAFFSFFPRLLSNGSYVKATTYLQKGQQIDRRLTPWFFWIVIFGLLVAEAGSFGLLLMVFVAPNAVSQDQILYGWIAAIVFAVVMLVITHRAGHEIFVNMLRSRVRDMRRIWFDANPGVAIAEPRLLSLDDTDADNNDPGWLQLANRVDAGEHQRYQPSHLFLVVAVGFALFFAITTFYLRDELFTQLSVQSQGVFDWGMRGPLLAFGILSAIFVALQLVSGWLGYHYGFAGAVTRQAAALRGHYPSVEAFQVAQELARERVERIAQNLLTRLQNALIDQDPAIARSSPQERTFLHFCVLKGDSEALKLFRRLAEQSKEAEGLAPRREAPARRPVSESPSVAVNDVQVNGSGGDGGVLQP